MEKGLALLGICYVPVWVSLPPFSFQPTNVLSSSSSFTVPGIKEDTSLLNEGFLQGKPEKPVAAPKPRSHFPTPAPVSAGHQRGGTCGTWHGLLPLPECPSQALFA